MTEYIDREALLRDIEHYHVSDFAFQHWVEIQPAADVAPVRHGRWLLDGRCSECLENPLTTHRAYCPNCGAKMDGGEYNGK